MRMLLALLPLLGLVAAQMNRQGAGHNNGQGPVYGRGNGGFFNDMGKSTSTLPPWAEHRPIAAAGGAQQAVPSGGSSNNPPVGGAAPIGGPQLPAVVGANADPGKSGGSSGGMAGFGGVDYFNGGVGPDVLSPNAAAPAPAGGRNTNQNSDLYGIGESDIPVGNYEAASRMMQQTMHNGQMGGGIGIGAGTGKVAGRTSGEQINPDYFGGGAGAGGGQGANHGTNGGNQGMMGGGQVPSTGNRGGMIHGGRNDPTFDTFGHPDVGGAGAHGPARSSAEVRHGYGGPMVPNGSGAMNTGGGGYLNNLVGKGDKDESGNSSAATAAGVAAGALIVAAAVGAVAFIIVRKRKHSRLINSA